MRWNSDTRDEVPRNGRGNGSDPEDLFYDRLFLKEKGRGFCLRPLLYNKTVFTFSGLLYGSIQPIGNRIIPRYRDPDV